MDMEDFKPNSNRSKEVRNDSNIPEKRVQKVITGTATTKKRNDLRKFADIFLPEDVSSVKSYIVNDVIIPKIKNVISETIDMLLYGSTGGSSKRSTASKISYRSYYDEPRGRKTHEEPRQRRGYEYEDVILDNSGEAHEIIRLMDEMVERYGMVSVADLYDLVGISPKHTDNKYGWMDISKAEVVRVRDKWMIKMPRVMPLD